MKTRALFIFNWRNISDTHITCIQQQAEQHDELIFLIDEADQLTTPLTGTLLTHLHHLFSGLLSVPFYLLPFAGKGSGPLYRWIRWRIHCPAFSKVFTDDAESAAAMQTLLKTRVSVVAAGNTHTAIRREPAIADKKIQRGLFITRAQPFHNGHVAFIEQMKTEVEEVIVLIAMANRSHQINDLLTAGERLAMVGPVLEAIIPGRYYLAALPYSDYSMENFYELEALLPPFDAVYTSNPSVSVMAADAGYTIKSLQKKLSVSSTQIRHHLLHGEDYRACVPQQVYEQLELAGIGSRLQRLAAKEER